jgi:NTE family protein
MALDGKTLGLALSGGGYRATLFGLGSLTRLNDVGLLGKLDLITSVSGGSILAGILAQRWNQLDFHDGRASNFEPVFARQVIDFCNRSIDIGAGLKGLANPFKSAGRYLTDCYDKHQFNGLSLKDIPKPGKPGNPTFIFYATSLQTGRSFRFRQDYIADWKLGQSSHTDLPLALAVAASSAFPPLFSPIVIKTNPKSWSGGIAGPERDAMRGRLVLSDGGVYDNMGLEVLQQGKVDYVLVSDAGAPFELETRPARGPLQMGRVRDILIDQTRALRKRMLIRDLASKRQKGAYWGIDTLIASYKDPGALLKDSPETAAMARVPTRLAAFDPDVQQRLIRWGYALADVAVRKRAGLFEMS